MFLGQKVEKNISDRKFIGDFLAMSAFRIKFTCKFYWSSAFAGNKSTIDISGNIFEVDLTFVKNSSIRIFNTVTESLSGKMNSVERSELIN